MLAAAKRPRDLAPIYRLADHLDATLAMGEDLLRQSTTAEPLAAGDGNDQINARHAAFTGFSRHIRALELAMTAHLLQARARATEVRHLHPQFAPLIGLFIGGTAALADAAAGRALGDITPTALNNGPEVLEFFTTRAMIAPETRSLAGLATLAVSDDYLLAARIHLGTLLDMIAQFLDSLDLAFDLYAEPRSAEHSPSQLQI